MKIFVENVCISKGSSSNIDIFRLTILCNLYGVKRYNRSQCILLTSRLTMFSTSHKREGFRELLLYTFNRINNNRFINLLHSDHKTKAYKISLTTIQQFYYVSRKAHRVFINNNQYLITSIYNNYLFLPLRRRQYPSSSSKYCLYCTHVLLFLVNETV